MRLEVCVSNGYACGGYSRKVCTNGKEITEFRGGSCVSTEFEVTEERLDFHGLYTLLPYDEDVNNARAVLVALGETKNEAFFYRTAKVLVKPKLFSVSFRDVKFVYSKLCGEYGSAIPHYCYFNGDFHVLSRRKSDADEAFALFRALVSYVNSLRSSVGCDLRPCF